jgi:hypothetical protein
MTMTAADNEEQQVAAERDELSRKKRPWNNHASEKVKNSCLYWKTRLSLSR